VILSNHSRRNPLIRCVVFERPVMSRLTDPFAVNPLVLCICEQWFVNFGPEMRGYSGSSASSRHHHHQPPPEDAVTLVKRKPKYVTLPSR